MKVVAADSGAAVLNERFKPLTIVAAAAGLVESPYKKISFCLAEPIFSEVENAPFLIVHELELCQRVLKEIKADEVHLDISLGSLNLGDLSLIQLSKMRVSSRARIHISKILPKIRKISSDIKRVYGIDVLAIGKESIPVRIAELTCGAYAVLYCAERVVKKKKALKLGLPAKCCVELVKGNVILRSLVPAEQDIVGNAEDDKKVLEMVQISEMLNPRARGFRVLEISPKSK